MGRESRSPTVESSDRMSYLPMSRPQHPRIADSCSPGHGETLLPTAYSVPDRAKERRPWHPSQGGEPWAEKGTSATEPVDTFLCSLGLGAAELGCDCPTWALAAGR